MYTYFIYIPTYSDICRLIYIYIYIIHIHTHLTHRCAHALHMHHMHIRMCIVVYSAFIAPVSKETCIFLKPPPPPPRIACKKPSALFLNPDSANRLQP